MKNENELKKLANGLSVLIVENDADKLNALVDYLKKIFKNTYEASDGMAGLELYKKENPSVVITALELSKMSGSQLIVNIKKINKFAPVIVLSEKMDSKILLESIRLGVVDFITHPLDYNLLDIALIKAIELSQIKNIEEPRALDEDSPFAALVELKNTNSPIQLISTYKGIPIIHKGIIVDTYNDCVEIQTRFMQTKAIEFNKRTVIESNLLPDDIEATLIEIDDKNAQVLLSNLKYIDYSPKRRKNARLEPSSDMKLMAYKKGGSKLNIMLKDISLTNLTFEIKHLPDFFQEDVILDLKLAFDIPESDLSYYIDKLCIINFQGKILKIHEFNDHFIVSIEFEIPKTKDSLFSKYLYNREIELISEFKRYAAKK